MKYQFLLLILVFTWFYACKRSCNTLFLNEGLLETYDPLTDSSAFIEKCGKGTNFVKVIDTTSLTLLTQNVIDNDAVIAYDFSNSGYDYRITILPSGRVYKITNIHYGDEKANDGCGGSNWTSCSYGYSINGTVYFVGATSHDDNSYNSVPLRIQ